MPATPRKRRRKSTYTPVRPAHSSTDSDNDEQPESCTVSPVRPRWRNSPATPSTLNGGDEDERIIEAANASEAEGEDQLTRLNNAYPGATNSIGSIHQRQWFLRLDQVNSGFVRAASGPSKGKWVRGLSPSERREDREHEVQTIGGFDTFFVRGAEHERSVVTGRLSSEVFDDEGIEGFMGRKMWRPVLE